MAKKKYPLEETVNYDICECVYCGYSFNGNDAVNGNLDCQSIVCPKCNKEMFVDMSVQYRCTPIED